MIELILKILSPIATIVSPIINFFKKSPKEKNTKQSIKKVNNSTIYQAGEDIKINSSK